MHFEYVRVLQECQKVADEETTLEEFEEYTPVNTFKPKPGEGAVGFVSLLHLCY